MCVISGFAISVSSLPSTRLSKVNSVNTSHSQLKKSAGGGAHVSQSEPAVC